MIKELQHFRTCEWMLTFRVVDRPPGSDPRTGVIFELATNRSELLRERQPQRKEQLSPNTKESLEAYPQRPQRS